jgi:hypothetical protein
MNSRRWYGGMLAIAITFIIWTVFNRYVFDPDAVGFLSHKSGLKRIVHVSVWITVLDVHIAFSSVALLTGAMNFSNGILQRYRIVHRMTGYVYLLSVLVVLLTSGYMAPYATGGKVVSVMFNLWNLAWFAVTLMAFVYIKQKRIPEHRNWMIRSYIFCFTNLSIHLYMVLFFDCLNLRYDTAYSCSVLATIILLPLVAETVIRTTLNDH